MSNTADVDRGILFDVMLQKHDKKSQKYAKDGRMCLATSIR